MLAAEIIFYGLLEEKTGRREWETEWYVDKKEKLRQKYQTTGFLEGHTRTKLKREYPEIFAETMEILTEKYLVDPAVQDFKNAAREIAMDLSRSTAVKRKVRSGYGTGHML